MKRISLFAALAITIVFAAALVNINRAAGDNHATQHHQQQKPQVDGAASAASIPDYAAHEIVLRLLSSTEPDKKGDRRTAWLRAAGFDEGSKAALMLAAHDYRRLVAQIEKDEDNIKNQTWPTPDRQTMDRLAGLQREKEAMINGVGADLAARLSDFNALARWEDHIAKKVKPKIKGFRVELPTKKVSFFRLIPDPFGAYAQASGCDALVYVYSDTVFDSSQLMVFGYTSYSVPSNNCGHTITPITTISGALSGSGGDGLGVSLDSGQGYYYAGNFFTQSSVDVFCPVVSQTYSGGSNASDVTVAAFITVAPYQLQNCSQTGNIRVNTSFACEIKVIGSNDAGGKTYQLSVGHEVASGNFTMEDTGGGQGTISTGTIKETIWVVSHTPKSLVGQSAQFRGKVDVSSSQVTVYGSPQTSSNRTIVP